MGNQEVSAPPPPPNGADMNADQKLYVLNALQVVGDWSVHDDGDGRLFYYDHKTNASQWEAPDSLASLETEFMMKLMLENAVAISGVWTAHDTGNGTLYYFNSKTRESVWERPGEWGATEAAAAEERDRQKITELAKYLREEEEQKSKEEKAAKKEKRKHKKQKEKRDAEEKAKENEHTQEEVEEEVPLTAEELQAEEERKAREMKRIEQFRAMLRDKNIMPFCKWSVALPQIAGDPRFIGVPTMDERRAIFEHFVEHRREDLKAEKKGKLKQAKNLFTNLLREQFQLDSWEPSTTFSVFLSTLESNIDSQRYKQIQNDALVLLTLSTQEKIYTKAVEEYKSEELKRDGEQLRLAKFLADKLNVHDKTVIAWEDDGAQLVREFYASAASTESTPLLSELKQKRVFEDLVARLNTNEASSVEGMSHKQLERSFSQHRSSRSRSNEHKPRESNPRNEPRHSRSHRRRSRSHSRRRRSRSDSRSQSREISRRNRSSRRRSASSSRSRSRSREERSSGRSSRYHRHRSKSRSRTRR